MPKETMEKIRIVTYILLISLLVVLTLAGAASEFLCPDKDIKVPVWLYLIVSGMIAGFGWIPSDALKGILGGKKGKK